MNKLEVRHLTKVFGKRQKQALEMVKEAKSKTEILQKTKATVGVYDANFEVRSGEIFVIMGLSGSGKSTLIRLLNRLIDPTYGDIYIDEQDIAKMNEEALREVDRVVLACNTVHHIDGNCLSCLAAKCNAKIDVSLNLVHVPAVNSPCDSVSHVEQNLNVPALQMLEHSRRNRCCSVHFNGHRVAVLCAVYL